MSERETVLVTGATGNIGSAVVHLLASDARAPAVRAATRDPASPAAQLLRAMNPATVQPVRFDAGDAGSLAAAFAGVTRLFVVAPYVEDMAGWHAAIGRAAAAAGTCAHVVKVSVTGARPPASEPPPGRFPLAHWLGEEALRATGIPTTAIRPNIFMQHFLDVAALYRPGDDRFHLPTGDAAVAFLDCRDVAALGAAVLMGGAGLRAAQAGRAYELTGPAAVTAREIAGVLGWAADRAIAWEDGEAAFVAHARAIGAPDFVRYIYAEARGGWFSKVETEEFEALTGRRPTSFAKFALDHAAHFRAR